MDGRGHDFLVIRYLQDNHDIFEGNILLPLLSARKKCFLVEGDIWMLFPSTVTCEAFCKMAIECNYKEITRALVRLLFSTLRGLWWPKPMYYRGISGWFFNRPCSFGRVGNQKISQCCPNSCYQAHAAWHVMGTAEHLHISFSLFIA